MNYSPTAIKTFKDVAHTQRPNDVEFLDLVDNALYEAFDTSLVMKMTYHLHEPWVLETLKDNQPIFRAYVEKKRFEIACEKAGLDAYQEWNT
jgi:hypothetical protein